MYSALRVEGKRLYELARQGVEVERKARPVTIHSLDFVSWDGASHTCRIDVHCSKGTYIRTLVADIGEALGCGAVMTGLRRTMAAGFTLADCVTIGEAGDLAREGRFAEALLPVGAAFAGLPRARLSEKQAKMFLNGVRLDPARVARPGGEGPFAVYLGEETFLGTAEVKNGEFRMVKLFTLEV